MAAALRALLVWQPGSTRQLRGKEGSRGAKEGPMTSLTLVRRIKARPQIVFDAVTTAEGISHWWGPDAGPVLFAECDPRVGGRYRVRFLRMLDSTEYESSGEFLELIPAKRVVMS